MKFPPFSRSSAARQPSAIRALIPFIKPGVLNLGGGMPNPELFPFVGMDISLRGADDRQTTMKLDGGALRSALQYSGSKGLPGFTEELKRLQVREHGLASDRAFDVIVGTGSQDLLDKTFRMFLDPGVPILVESPTYSGALASLRATGARLVPVRTDEFGLSADDLRRQLSQAVPADQQRPRLLYTIPTGQNPSGATQSTARRRAVYDVCQEFDVLILEDDPYFYLQFPSQADRPPSLFSLDRPGDERVLRFDSFSKILSSGLRLGFASGPPALIRQLELDNQASCLHASGLSQQLVLSLLQEWGSAGWQSHVSRVAKFYAERCQKMCAAVREHLSEDVEFVEPVAGMFLWLKVRPEKMGSRTSTHEFLTAQAITENRVIAVFGDSFSPAPGGAGDPCQAYFRVAFSVIPEDEMEEACKRISSLINQ